MYPLRIFQNIAMTITVYTTVVTNKENKPFCLYECDDIEIFKYVRQISSNIHHEVRKR